MGRYHKLLDLFAAGICRHRRKVLVIALVLAIPAFLSALTVSVNYDIFSYMPEKVESVRGQRILEEKYHSAATGFVLLEKRSIARLLHLKQDLAAIDGVSRVIWLSDFVDPAIPGFFVPPAIREVFQKGDRVLLVLLFAHPTASDKTMAAVSRVRERLQEASLRAYTGLPVLLEDLTRLVNQEKVRAIIAAVVVSTLVVGLAMGSVAVPFLFLFSIGLAVIYNMGTNFLQGSISYVTEAVAAVIQLGVTFDFSIFLTHRFHEETSRYPNPHQAMREAIRGTFRAVAPAALTTIAGFLSLGLMQIGIGLDMGIVMAKGVFLGLVTSLTVLPALLLLTHERIRVRDVGSAARRYRSGASFLMRYRLLLLILFVLIFLPALYGRYRAELSYSIQDMLPENMPSVQAMDTIKKTMGYIEVANIILPEETPRPIVGALTQSLNRMPFVDRAVSLASLADPAVPESFVPGAVKQVFNKGGYTQILAVLTVELGTDAATAAVTDIRKLVSGYDVSESYVAGTAAITRDLVELSGEDIARVNKASLICVLLIVALMFGSAAIPVILVAGIQLAIYINLALPYYLGHAIPFLTFTAISAIQLGTTVDYAILLMSRYQEERRQAGPVPAMVESLCGTTPAILISGMSLFAATIGMVFISHVDTLRSMALMIGRGALISMSVIVLLVPAVIVIFDKLIVFTSFGWRKNSAREKYS